MQLLKTVPRPGAQISSEQSVQFSSEKKKQNTPTETAVTAKGRTWGLELDANW